MYMPLTSCRYPCGCEFVSKDVVVRPVLAGLGMGMGKGVSMKDLHPFLST